MQTITTPATTGGTWADVSALLDGGRHVLAWAGPADRRGMLPCLRHSTRGGILRAPHHTVSPAGILGTITYSRDRQHAHDTDDRHWRVAPGEVTLAHGGILLLDDAAEFQRLAIEGAAHAARDGVVRLLANGRVPVTVGAACVVLGVSARCPCGFLGHHDRACICAPRAIDRFATRARQGLASLDPVEITIGGNHGA